MTWIVIAFAAVIIVGIGVAWTRSTTRHPSEISMPVRDLDDGIVSDPVPIAPHTANRPPDISSPSGASPAPSPDEGAVAIEKRRSQWSRQFETAGAPLSDEARMRLIGDLAMVDSDWSKRILQDALVEETDPRQRAALQMALGNKIAGIVQGARSTEDSLPE